jgi:hypothetical protein
MPRRQRPARSRKRDSASGRASAPRAALIGAWPQSQRSPASEKCRTPVGSPGDGLRMPAFARKRGLPTDPSRHGTDDGAAGLARGRIPGAGPAPARELPCRPRGIPIEWAPGQPLSSIENSLRPRLAAVAGGGRVSGDPWYLPYRRRRRSRRRSTRLLAAGWARQSGSWAFVWSAWTSRVGLEEPGLVGKPDCLGHGRGGWFRDLGARSSRTPSCHGAICCSSEEGSDAGWRDAG